MGSDIPVAIDGGISNDKYRLRIRAAFGGFVLFSTARSLSLSP
jgi:hypothetical protein